MRLGIITDQINDNPTGIGNYAESIIRSLMTRFDLSDLYFIDYKRKKFHKGREIIINNPFILLKTYLWHNIIPLFLKSKEIDYVFNFSGCPHLTKFRMKEIFFVYDISWLLYPKFHKRGRVYYHRLLFKLTLKNSYHIIADSYHTKNDLIKYFHVEDKKISVIYPRLPIEETNISKPEFVEGKYILFVSTLEPRKNVIAIVKAFSKVLKKNYKYKLILAGKKGWDYDPIFKAIEEEKLEGSIVVTGYIKDKEKAYLYKHAEFFVYPSFYEGFGIPVIEAMMYKCPVITSNVSSLPEVVGDAALLVDPLDFDKLANHMIELIENKKLRNDLVVRSKNRLRILDNEEQIKMFFKELNI